MQGMRRVYESLLEEYLRIFPVVAILGPRQCGKTTLLKTLPVDWHRFDLENDADLLNISHDPSLFLKLNPHHAAIDEAQLLPTLFPALRVAVDKDRAKRGRFVITGSSSPALIEAISENLAGRVGVIEMAPFTAAEAFGKAGAPFADALGGNVKNLQTSLLSLKPRLSAQQIHRYWFEGGYPEPWIENQTRFRDLWTQEYVRSYVERDIARLFPNLNRDRFRTFVRLLAGMSGTIVNHADVGRALGVSQPTARDYFEIAHGSFFWRTLPAFSRSSLKRLVRHPKGYLRDSGLLHHLLRIPDADALMSHPCMGASWEGLVVENIMRGLAASGVGNDASHYRTGGGAEVDLVLEGNFGTLPIEIKHTQSVDPKQLRSLKDFVAEWNCPLGVVINNDEAPRMLTEKIVGIPFGCL
jgi:uncharacterized protein